MAALAGVLLALVLLGVEVWVVGISLLAYVVARGVTGPVLLRAGAGMAASAIAYVTLVVLASLLSAS